MNKHSGINFDYWIQMRALTEKQANRSSVLWIHLQFYLHNFSPTVCCDGITFLKPSNLSSNISLSGHNAKVSERYDILSSIQQIYNINFQSLEFYMKYLANSLNDPLKPSCVSESIHILLPAMYMGKNIHFKKLCYVNTTLYRWIHNHWFQRASK